MRKNDLIDRERLEWPYSIPHIDLLFMSLEVAVSNSSSACLIRIKYDWRTFSSISIYDSRTLSQSPLLRTYFLANIKISVSLESHIKQILISNNLIFLTFFLLQLTLIAYVIVPIPTVAYLYAVVNARLNFDSLLLLIIL